MSRRTLRWHVVRVIIWMFWPIAFCVELVKMLPQWWAIAAEQIREDVRVLHSLNDQSERAP